MIVQLAFGDYEHELQQTRRLLDAIPDDKLEFKPHTKSWPLGGLAQHIAQLPWWFAETVRGDEFDLAAWERLAPPKSKQEIIDRFERNAADARTALSALTPEALERPWTLRSGSHVIFTMPKAATLRLSCISHLIHHRAQLTIYLRIIDAKVPGLYGPSADEQ
jgi:uncharacterized damage-inducible protein DinB